MQYTSTRNSTLSVTASHAIAVGLSEEGGLFVPESIPQINEAFITNLGSLPYEERAVGVLSLYLTDFSQEQLRDACNNAYTDGVFESDCPAPLSSLSDGRFLLELWHGPTCAFKDMALQLMPQLLVPAVQRTFAGRKVLILAATSGDTGKAALEGFADVAGVSIAVFYPDKGVSEMQRLQMATQSGENVAVFAVQGNFDSAQTQVKKIFTDAKLIEQLKSSKVMLSSANSINWGRLVPQIVYYFSAYADLLANNALKPMQKINVVVPTGNFGNILSAYYAMRMGLPVAKLICASNRNNILTDFFDSGVYDTNRAFHNTLSPSMDILVSSNLERLLYEINDRSAVETERLMQNLQANNKYEITPMMHQRIKELFWAGWMDDAECKQVIADIYKQFGYTADPHTAIGIGVHQRYRKQTGDNTPTVIASTASPFKFAATVLDALNTERIGDDFAQLKTLSTITGMSCPEALLSLREKPRRFNTVLAPSDMADAVINMAVERKEP